MDALKIGLETTIVGALALPWVFLFIDLFCPAREELFRQTLSYLSNQAVAAGVGWPSAAGGMPRSFTTRP